MDTLTLLTKTINFLVVLLKRNAAKLDAKAEADTRRINILIARRIRTLERANQAGGLANNISKFLN